MSSANAQKDVASPVDWASSFVSHARRYIGVSVKEQLRVEETAPAKNAPAKPKKEEDLSLIQLRERLEAKKAELRDQSHKHSDPTKEKKNRKRDKNQKVKDNKAQKNNQPKQAPKPAQEGQNGTSNPKPAKPQAEKKANQGPKPEAQKNAGTVAVTPQAENAGASNQQARGAWDKKPAAEKAANGNTASDSKKKEKHEHKGGKHAPKGDQGSKPQHQGKHDKGNHQKGKHNNQGKPGHQKGQGNKPQASKATE